MTRWVMLHSTDAIAVKDSDTSQEMVIRAIPDNIWQAFLEEKGITDEAK